MRIAVGAQHGQVGACYEETCVGNARQHLHGCPQPLERPEPLISITEMSAAHGLLLTKGSVPMVQIINSGALMISKSLR